MEPDEDGTLRFTPREELIIATVMVAEDNQARSQEESLIEAIIQRLFERARMRSAFLGVADNQAFDFANEAQDWLYDVLEARWPLRLLEGAERFLTECNEEYVSEEQARIEQLVERCRRSAQCNCDKAVYPESSVLQV